MWCIKKKDVSHLQLHVTWDYGIVPVSINVKVSAYDINFAVMARTSTEGSRQIMLMSEFDKEENISVSLLGDLIV